ncbi:unnamed protein product [Cyprideis torosa]|uniref:Uncharacterized protein n=1 Tax=Cyprideis torosa TaxID=163714 RepID=A0A7R8ZGJ0_9CRUS|nr:unnamed protein product [Cyprideis torosa]CAG0880159.1 unnamed protein product [Cyprideis torosa]
MASSDHQLLEVSTSLVMETLEELVRVSTTSPVDSNAMKVLEARLRHWEIQPGYHRFLAEVNCQPQLNFHVRWLSILCLKNGVEKYWRRFAPYSLTNEEKNAIQSALIRRVGESTNELAIQQAVIIGKIARFSYPKEWPTLFIRLLEYLCSPEEVVVRRALLILHESLKSVASKRLAEDRHNFSVLASSTFEPLCHSYLKHFEEFCSAYFSGADSVLVAQSLEKVHLALKCLQDLLLNGNNGVMSKLQFVPLLKALLQNLVTILGFLSQSQLRHADLDTWASDPEEFSKEEAHEAWRFSLRPTCERFFQCLFHDYAAPLISLILQCLPALQNEINPNNMQQILERDAILTAIGIPAYHLYEDIDFDRLYQEVLVREMTNPHPNARILKRRSAWLVGEWTGVRFAASLRPALYECLIRLLQPSEDLVVRLSAGTALKKALDDFDFDAKDFLPFCEGSFTGLVDMIKVAQDGDTKMATVRILNFLLERMGMHLQKQLDALAWYLMQCLGTNSKELHKFLIPIIGESVDKNLEAHVYMMEDALNLWLEIVHNVQDCSPDLLKLYEYALPILECGGESLRPVLVLSLGYILLCPETFLKTYGDRFQKALLELLPDIVREGEVAILRTVEAAFRLMPYDAPVFFRPILEKILVRLLQGAPHVVITQYLSLFARTWLFKRDLFKALIEDAGVQFHQAVFCINTAWRENLPLLSDLDRRKLFSLCLLTMLGEVWTPSMFGEVMTPVMQVLYDLRSDEESEISFQLTGLAIDDEKDHGVADVAGFESDGFIETEHDKRRRRMIQQDVAHQTSLFAVARQELTRYELESGMEPPPVLNNEWPGKSSTIASRKNVADNITRSPKSGHMLRAKQSRSSPGEHKSDLARSLVLQEEDFWEDEDSGSERRVEEHVNFLESFWQTEFRFSEKVEYVTEHWAVAVDKVVLFQRIQDDWNSPIEHLRQTGFWVSMGRLHPPALQASERATNNAREKNPLDHHQEQNALRVKPAQSTRDIRLGHEMRERKLFLRATRDLYRKI